MSEGEEDEAAGTKSKEDEGLDLTFRVGNGFVNEGVGRIVRLILSEILCHI